MSNAPDPATRIIRPAAGCRVPWHVYNDTMTIMRFERAGRRFQADFSRPHSIAIPLDFDGPQPACFGAPPAVSRPLRTGSFVGDTRAGGSCNCDTLTLAPHCNGTHTECVGHLTEERVAVAERIQGGMFFALVVSVRPVAAAAAGEDSDPSPLPDDRLVTAAALAAEMARHAGPPPEALVIRTLSATDSVPIRNYRGPAPAPYLSRQAAEWLVARGIRHLVLDLPSADRADDGGKLTAHRVFFGLPPGSRRVADAARADASISELAWVGPEVADGHYLLDLQIPAFLADAAPSRPLLYAVQPA
jgi:kynurenine formamidase